MFNKHLLTDWWNKPTQDLGDNAFFVCVLREHRWVHFYYQAFLPHWREQASQNLNHQQRGSCSQKKPSGFFHTCVHSQQQSRAQLLLNNAELWRHTPDANQPWRHPGLLTMNIITATSNRLHIKKPQDCFQFSIISVNDSKHPCTCLWGQVFPSDRYSEAESLLKRTANSSG